MQPHFYEDPLESAFHVAYLILIVLVLGQFQSHTSILKWGASSDGHLVRISHEAVLRRRSFGRRTVRHAPHFISEWSQTDFTPLNTVLTIPFGSIIEPN